MMNDQAQNGLDNPNTLTFSSTLALEKLSEFASGTDAQLFTHLLRPAFGLTLSPTLFAYLQRDLIAKTFNNPPCVVKDDLEQLCSYNQETSEIAVRREAIVQASEQPEKSAILMVALMEAFALHIYYLFIRCGSQDKALSVAPPPPENCTQAFVQTLLFYIKPITAGTVFAVYTQAGTEHNLALSIPETPSRRQKRFAPGRGDDKIHTSFGHESIEDALETVGFDEAQRKAIYFGNWLRDYSQLIDPSLVRPVSDVSSDTAHILNAIAQNQLPRVSREKLTAIVDLFALKEFHSLQQTPEGRDNYKVTQDMLGVYRAHEHIDNPTKLDREAFDPRSIDPDFTALVFPEDSPNRVLPKRSMKRYIRRPIAYMIKKLEAAKAEGMTPRGMRYFGEALHVLEDYFAHSNFVELSLIKLGHTDVLPWTTGIESRNESRHELPVITGVFGALDIVASVTDPLATLLYGNDDTAKLEAGERSDFDNVITILLKDEDPFLVKAFDLYLSARDSLKSNPLYEWISTAKTVSEIPRKAVEHACNLIKKPLLKWAGDHVATLQSHLDGDPNQNADIMATHSQLAKDHDTHPFHGLAVLLAALAVRDVGKAMFDHWMGRRSDDDPRILSEQFIVHPNDTDWFTQTVERWAQENPDKIEQGKSLETLRQLQSEELDQTLKLINDTYDTAVKHIEETEDLTNTSFWEITNMLDAGPAPWSF